MRCPKAKLLVGTWHCPCHGMDVELKPAAPRRPSKSRKRCAPGFSDDELAAGLLKVLQKIQDQHVSRDPLDGLVEVLTRINHYVKGYPYNG